MSPIRPEIESLELSGIGKIAAGALDDPEVIPLWFGESDLVTPDFIREAAKRALDDGKTFYNYTRGHKPLRDALKRYLDRIYGLDLDPDRISASGSTMLTVMIAGQCLVRPGDEVVLVGPYWPNIRTVVEVLGGRAVEVRLHEGAGPLVARPRRRAGGGRPADARRLRQLALEPDRLGDERCGGASAARACAASTGWG